MVQHFLDPSDKTTVGEWRPDRGVPESIRDAFGRYPNIDQWRPGDLLLFHIPEKTPLASRLIIKAQLANYALEHARWHHAAMYVGEGSLCEAHMVGGVQHNSINDYVGRHHIRVRRDMTLSEEDRHKLAIRAMARLKESYGWYEIPKLAFSAIRGFWHPSKLALGTKGVICSHLYNMAYQGVTKRILFDTGDRLIVPAELSLTDVLTDVPVCWRRIARQ